MVQKGDYETFYDSNSTGEREIIAFPVCNSFLDPVFNFQKIKIKVFNICIDRNTKNLDLIYVIELKLQ